MTTPLADIIGAPRTITIGGKRIVIKPLLDEDWAAFEQWMQQNEIAIAKTAIEDIDDIELKKAMLTEATARASKIVIGSLEASRIMTSVRGVVELLWIATKEHNKGLTKDELVTLIAADPQRLKESVEEFTKAQGETENPLAENVVPMKNH